MHLKLYNITANLIQVNNLCKEFDNFAFNKKVKIIEGVLEL